MNAPTTTRPGPSSDSDHDEDPALDSADVKDQHHVEGNIEDNPSNPPRPSMDPYKDARALVRLIQCEICHKILHQPIALPCGEALCKSCLPTTYERENISYPAAPERLRGFICPFESCNRSEHAVADCGIDVTLSRVLEGIAETMRGYQLLPETPDLLLEELPMLQFDTLEGVPMRSKMLKGGRLTTTYKLAETGELKYSADLRYTVMSSDIQRLERYDEEIFEIVMTRVRPELECQVCYSLLLDPVTTGCGHTFCRGCLERVLDHSTLCPLCRRNLPPFGALARQMSNKKMATLLSNLCSEVLQQRLAVERAHDEEEEDTSIPLFVCALSFPTMPMFIHIFEPRYRLMIRRALESPSRSFGMVNHNRNRVTQGPDGSFQAPFMQYGLMLYIVGIQMLDDGRSLIETIGTTRFKVASWGNRDGYTTAKVERVDDIPTADEESMESMERMFHTFPEGSIPEWARLPTQDLLRIGLDFVSTMRRSSAGWFHDRILRTYGDPPTDPAYFPYWLATLLPVSDDEKYHLLVATSVRERLKIVVGWIKTIEQRHWFTQAILTSSCTIS